MPGLVRNRGVTVAADYLTQASLLRLLAVMLLVIAPHFWQLPLWVSTLSVTVIVWRAVAAQRQWRLPGTLVRSALALAGFLGVYATYGRSTGQTVGTALLVVMLALKLTEMRARRDVMLVMFLLYFVMFTHFLVSQELWTILYLLVCAVAITAMLAEASHPGSALSPRFTLPVGARMVAAALPLMVIMFVLFPRIPGPLWGLPGASGASGRTGLSDSMEPGEIAQLMQSDEVAFRVTFLGTSPPMRQRYWRGPVFWFFDGRRWEMGSRGRQTQAPSVEFSGAALRYEMTLEPQRSLWLLALELPEPGQLPLDSRLGPDHQLVARKPSHDRRVLRLTSYPNYVLQRELPEEVRRLNTRWPGNRNPRTLELAQQLRAEHDSDAALVDRVLHMYREQEFFYTLEPPLLGADAVDEFLFETRRGFCEHYASSFTALMRAAGIPARVVTGYQGGEINEIGGYMVVRDSDAHAWSEVWLADRGWVRVDPTAAVAPARIELGIEGALAASGERLPGLGWSRAAVNLWFTARWDWINANWNGLVLAYGPQLQMEFLGRFGLRDWGHMVALLTILLVGVAAMLGAWHLWQMRPRPHPDAAQREWQRYCAWLAARGLARRPGEGPLDFTARLVTRYPAEAAALARVRDCYMEARYLRQAPPQTGALAAEIKELRRRLRRM